MSSTQSSKSNQAHGEYETVSVGSPAEARPRGAKVISMSDVIGQNQEHQGAAGRESRESRSWRDRTTGLNPEVARLLLSDTILTRLDAVHFGVVLRLHAMTRAGSPLTSRVRIAAKVLGLPPRRLGDVILELQTLSPGLIREEGGCFVCDALISRQFVAHTEKRSAAAEARWAATRAQNSASGAQDAGPSTDSGQTRPVGFRCLQQATKAAAAPSQNRAGQPLVEPDAPLQGALFEGPESSGGTGKDAPSKRAPPCPVDEIVNLYNSICVSLTRVKPSSQWTSSGRLSRVAGRWNSYPSLAEWKKFFERVEKSLFLTGRQNSPWRADFDWILKPANFDRILEGVYDNHPGGGGQRLWNRGQTVPAAQGAMESVIDESAPFLNGGTSSQGVR